MKLKNRFITIIVGTFLIPILVSGLAMFLFVPDFVSFREEFSGIKDLTDELDSAQTLHDIIDFAEGLPRQLFMVVFDEDNHIVYRKDAVNDDRIFEEDTHQQSIITRHMTMADGTVYTVMLGVSAVSLYMPYTGIAVVGSVLVFLSFLSALTVRSINKSISRLEEGTRRIAAGDLDTPIVLYGDDTFVSLANSFDTMRKKVKEEYDRRTRFFMGVSHDLKTPLASITGYTEALLDGLADDAETRDRYLRIIHAKGELLDRRIAKLIQYIKLTNNAFQSHLEQHMLVPFLQDFIDLQTDEASLLGYKFEAEVNIDSTTVVSFDQDLLSRTLENLLQNSYRHGDVSKPVRMLCQYQEDTIRISFVNHHKTPIPKDVIEHMFEPFYRGDHSRKGEGFGLGLASVKSIAESHGWRVEMRSLEKEGITVFQIVIPMDQTLQQG